MGSPLARAAFPQAGTILLDSQTKTERATPVREPEGLSGIRAALPAHTLAHVEAYRNANAARARRLLEPPWPGPIPVQITLSKVELVDVLGVELEAWARGHWAYRICGGRLGNKDRTMLVLPWIEYTRFSDAGGEKPRSRG